MKRIKTERIHNTALLFILIAPFSIIYYCSYLFNPFNAGNPYLYMLQILADSIAIVNLGALWLTILLDLIQPEYNKRDLEYDKNWISQKKTSIDILIPVAYEPYEIVERTIQGAVAMDYDHKTYMLDDGNSADFKNLAEKMHVHYIARPPEEKRHAKSGNLNYGLQFCNGEFFAIFDADHVPEKEFITELLPFFKNKNVALVQTPQHYTNTKNFIASGTSQAQEIFYKYVQPAKNSYNASFCVGTNMLYRRKAIDEIGGIALRDHSEDIWTTISLHEKGYESVFYNKVLAKGKAPDTIQSFFRQQNRWARGGFSLFFTHNPLFEEHLSTDQKLQYFFSNIHYFSGFSILIYLILPIIYLLFNQHPMNVMNGGQWAMHYIPYFITIYFLPFFLLRSLKIATVGTAIASFSPYLKAFFSVVMKNKYKWIATGSNIKKFNLIMLDIWPHMFFISLSLLSIIVGWYNVVDFTTTSFTTFWVLLNTYFLFAFIKNGLSYEISNA